MTALDPRSGEESWSQPSNGSATGDDGAVYAVSCSGPARARSCAMSAYDVADGSTLWTTPIDGETDFAKVVDGKVLARFSDQDRFAVLDAASGTVLADRLRRDSRQYLAYERADEPRTPAPVVVGQDRDPQDGCRATVSLRDQGGSARWTTRLADSAAGRTAPTRCPVLSATRAGDDVVVSATEPGRQVPVDGSAPGLVLLDGRDGSTLWTSQRPLSTFGRTSAGVLVALDGLRPVGIDLRSGRELWVEDEDYDVVVTTRGRYFIGNYVDPVDRNQRTVVLDIRTGERLLTLPGSLLRVRRDGGVGLLMKVPVAQTYRYTYAFVRLPPVG